MPEAGRRPAVRAAGLRPAITRRTSVTFLIGEREAGKRLDLALVLLADLSRSQARRWIEAQIRVYQESDDQQAQLGLRQLQNDLAYIDRMAVRAGGEMLGSGELEALGQRTDAESQYKHAIQLLVGHGNKRRSEAVAELQEAARKGHGGAAWRLVEIYDRGFPQEIDQDAALRYLQLAVTNHDFAATRELAVSYEKGKRGLAVDLPRAIELYEAALAAGHDNRHGWNLDPDNFNHFKWLESRLRQTRLKQESLAKGTDFRGWH